jgi:hypothetical protein
MCSAKGYVRFTPNSDRESEIPQMTMSVLTPKADMEIRPLGKTAKVSALAPLRGVGQFIWTFTTEPLASDKVCYRR